MKHITSILVSTLWGFIICSITVWASFFLWNYLAVTFGLPELTLLQILVLYFILHALCLLLCMTVSVLAYMYVGLDNIFMFKNKKDN